MLDIYNEMKAEKMHSGVSRCRGMGEWDPARLRGLSEGQERLSLPKNPRSDLSEGLVLLMRPRQGHGGTVPKRS